MALARVTVWVSGQVLTAAAQNAEFNNILDNALALISPLTGNLDFNGNRLDNLASGTVGTPGWNFSGDTNTGGYRVGADIWAAAAAGVDVVRFTGTSGGVNYVDVYSESAGFAPRLAAEGSSTNISLRFVPKGTGYVQVATAGGYVGSDIVPALALADFDSGVAQLSSGTVSLVAEGREAARFFGSPSATSYLTLVGGDSGATPYLSVGGVAANIDLELRAKGSGVIKAATAFVATAFMGGGQPAVNGLYAQQIPRAWASVTSSITLEDSFNVASLTDEVAAGTFTVNFHRPMGGQTYVPLGMSQFLVAGIAAVTMNSSKNRQADSCTLTCFRTDTGASSDASAFVVFFGRQ